MVALLEQVSPQELNGTDALLPLVCQLGAIAGFGGRADTP
jgi:hypothetical protein